MTPYILHFNEIDQSKLPQVGGKGANLGELYHLPGVKVPDGFCITTRAYQDFVGASVQFDSLLQSLERLDYESPTQLQRAGIQLRGHLESLDIPTSIQQAVLQAWENTGSQFAYAVRSSATAEDLPGASFAGQQDTYLNIIGPEDLLSAIKKCWASLFTDRALIYRHQNGFSHLQVFLSVVVQRMVFPEVSGIMFTADPVTGARKNITIDASFGLGEALVSGLVSPDLYQVRGEQISKKEIAPKKVAIIAKPEGGTIRQEIPLVDQTRSALSDEVILHLAEIGRSLEQHFGAPQDIEWGLKDEELYILQSRPITTLYPLPTPTPQDASLHLFFSFGHVQMMLDPMKPLGISVFRTLFPFGKPVAPQDESLFFLPAGSRIFIDITKVLQYRKLRKVIPTLLLNVDEQISGAVSEFIEREEFKTAPDSNRKIEHRLLRNVLPVPAKILRNIVFRNHSQAHETVNQFLKAQFEETQEKLENVSGVARIRRIQDILSVLMKRIFLKVIPEVAAAMVSYKIIETLSHRWLGDASQLGAISKSPPGNVTTEMGLALGDVADVVRDYPAVVDYLKNHPSNAGFITGLRAVPGGEQVHAKLTEFIVKYGMRCPGEVDLTRPRWREIPGQLAPAILSQTLGVEPGQHRRDFAQGTVEADEAAAILLDRVRKTRLGFVKSKILSRFIEVYRHLIGLREHPKYHLIRVLDLIKQSILHEANALAAAGILTDPEDIFWLSLPEIVALFETRRLDQTLITRRKTEFHQHQKMSPPRVMTGDGEIITGRSRKTNIPPGALVGTPVSAGVAEGRARVILKLEEAHLNKGDILVTPFTDPSWTPLFPPAAALVTEVGGLMTHGAVVAREYGIPAVVGVNDATRRIRDGQRIRVDGNQGLVEILE